MTIETVPECPHCNRSDKVEKVSAIVDDGFSTTPIQDGEPFQWGGKTYYIKYKQRDDLEIQKTIAATNPKLKNYKTTTYGVVSRERVSTSPLANRLLPRIEQPKIGQSIPKLLILYPLGWLGISVGLAITGIVRRIISLVVIGLILVFPLIISSGFIVSIIKLADWSGRKEQNEYTQKVNKKREAEEKWSKLYYCYRCEGVFSQNSEFMSVHKLESYLFGIPEFGAITRERLEKKLQEKLEKKSK